MPEQQRYAIFSESQAKIHGTSFYLRPDGTQVEVTEVGLRGCPATKWDDKVDLGPVTHYVAPGRRPAYGYESSWINPRQKWQYQTEGE